MGTASPTLTRPLMTIPTTKVLQIALVTPLQGPAGIFGPSCEAGRYTNRYGPEAPVLNSMGESCYEGVRLLAALIQRAGGLDVPGLCSVADTVGYGGPRGEVHLQKCHLDQPIYLARADDLQFDVITSFRRTRQDER